MALEVIIRKGSGGATNYLKCDVVDHSFTRLVTQSGLPSEAEGSAPSADGVFLLDLGICIEQITLTGIVDDSPDDGSISRDALEVAVRSWWAYGDTDASLCKITYSTVAEVSYYGGIRTSTFRKTAGNPARWEYSITFLVKSKV